MADNRFVDCIYCDDIRNEVGNKLTLVGCYGADLIVERIPITLPKLCVLVKLFTSSDQPFERLTIRVFIGDTAVAELPIPREPQDHLPTGNSRWIVINAALTLSPFFVERECTMRVEAETEEGTLIGPKLRVRPRDQRPLPSSPPTFPKRRPTRRKRQI